MKRYIFLSIMMLLLLGLFPLEISEAENLPTESPRTKLANIYDTHSLSSSPAANGGKET